MLERLDCERYDYSAFLRRFAVTGEVMHAYIERAAFCNRPQPPVDKLKSAVGGM